MCELMTIAAAIAVSLAALLAKRAGRPVQALGTTALALWGAALMWSVDCVHSFIEGEGFFDLSTDDALLGGIILAAAALLFAAMHFLSVKQPNSTQTTSLKNG